MEANVKYGDLKGTVAADTNTPTTLTKHLSILGVNTDRYEAIGIELKSGGRSFKASIICMDKKKSVNNVSRTVKVPLSTEMKLEDFFILFKRFHIILMNKTYNEDILNEYDTSELSSSEYSNGKSKRKSI